MASYFAATNGYVKAFSDLDSITSNVLAVSQSLKEIDLSCFDDLDGFSGQVDSWKANILTSSASALMAASYSDRLYSRSVQKQKELRELARKDLSESIYLFDKDEVNAGKLAKITKPKPSCENESRLKSGTPSSLLSRWTWSERRSFARNLLLRIPPDSD